MRALRILILLAAASGAAGASAGEIDALASAQSDPRTRQATTASAGEDTDGILVTGERERRGSVAGVPPLDELGDAAIAAYAANSIGDLLAALDAQVRAADADGPHVLVNGERIGSLAEVSGIPPEALRRVEILPEETALRFGLPADRPVVNLVLRENFRALTANAAGSTTTGGGAEKAQLDLDLARIAGPRRWNIHARYNRDAGLTEAERSLEASQGEFRSLLPDRERGTLDGSWSGKLGPSVSVSANVSLDLTERTSRIGPSRVAGRRFLMRETSTRAFAVGGSANGAIGKWSWFASADLDHSTYRSRTQRDDVSGAAPLDLSRSDATFLTTSLVFAGGLFDLPGGGVNATLSLDAAHRDFDSSASHGDESDLSRSTGQARLALDLPLFDGLAGEIVAGATEHSDFSGLTQTEAALRWRPSGVLRLRAAWSREESAPSVQDLGNPLIATPNVRLFDFASGEAVDVVRLDGGNPALLSETRRRLRLSASLRPRALDNLALTASFVRLRIDDPVGPIPLPTAEIEAAFPGRLLRSADGTLVTFDARPINYHRSESDRLRWGLNWSKRFDPAAGDENDAAEAIERQVGKRQPGSLVIGLSHAVRLRSRLQTLEDGPVLDFLDGSAGAASRHEVRADLAWTRGGLGARFDASWLSGFDVVSAGRVLDYEPLARIDLKLHASLDELVPRSPGYRWAEDMRIALEFENLFNERRRITDRSGVTPLALQRAYLDPEGASIRLSLRKLF